jgi:subtilisin family serine protease
VILVGVASKGTTVRGSRCPFAVRAALVFALACVAVSLLPSGGALATPSRTSRLIAAFDGRGGRPSDATRHALARLDVRLSRPVFRGHRDWNIWEVEARGSGAADAVASLERTPGVRWAERDASLSYDSPEKLSSSFGGGPFGTLVAPDPTAPLSPSAELGTASTDSSTLAPLAPSTCTTPGSSCAAPPTSCTPGSAAGLDAGQANDPLFCNETNGPYYAEEWNNFCFVPQTQAASVMAASPRAPGSSGTCNAGAWKLGAQGQGTVIAILDSGINYYHQDLQDQMVDPSNDPLLSDPDYPGAIHGWNFYDDNPDPMDYFGHGTGRAGLAAAEADNSVGMAGASPKSLLMAVKVGDTYVVHSENLAQGVVYAADHGADVINTSLGSTGNSKLLRAAATYAYSKGVFWAGATANEYSTHHNYPTNLDTVAGAGGLGPNLAEQQSQTCQSVGSSGATNCAPADPQTTFLQKVNYANYGGIQTFAAPIDTVGTSLGDTGYGLHQSGTSTATPHLAAAGAIVRSAGFRAGLCGGHADISGALTALGCDPQSAPDALSSNEVRQLLAYTATRIHNDDASSATNNYPPNPSGDPTRAGGEYYPQQGGDRNLGWNIWSGFGRPDIYAAAAYAEQGLIPPEAQLFGDEPPPGPEFAGLKGPVPFAVYDPAKTPTLTIVGHVAAPRLDSGQNFAWKVQVAPCLEPVEADFSDVPGGSGTGPKDGVLATWTLPTTTATCTHQSSGEHPFSFPGTYTVRVLSTVDKNGGGGFLNPTWTGPGLTDTDQDPNRALPQKAPLYGQDRRIVNIRPSTAADHDGSPYYLGASGEGSPTLYDLEGRSELDVIEATSDGDVLALRPDGTPVPGWPVSADPLSAPHNQDVNGTPPTGQIVSSVAVGDLDGDKQPEVVAASFKGGVYAWHRDGSRVAGFPVQVPPVSQYTAPPQPSHPVNPSPPFGDQCTDSHPATSDQRYSDYGSISAPVLANLEKRTDGKLDIVQAGANQCIYVIGPDGSVLGDVYANDPTTNANSRPAKIADTPAVGDIDNDGNLDIVVGTEEIQGSTGNTSGRIYAFDGFTLATTHTASPLPGWPVVLPSLAAAGVPAVATGVISSPALLPSTAGDGTLQTATGVFLAGSDTAHPAFTIDADGSQGTILQTNSPGAGSNFTDSPFLWAVAQTAVGQVGSTSKAIVTGGLSAQIATDTAGPPGKKPGFQHAVGAYDPMTGAAVPTFPRQIEDWQFLSGTAIADVKGDGSHQVIGGSGGGFLHAFDPASPPAGAPNNLSTSLSRYTDGAEPSGFPVFTGGHYITSTPTVGQLSRADKVAVATVTRDGYLFLTDTQGTASANDQWWHFHHDERNTGLYGFDTRPPATVDDLSAAPGAASGTATVTWTEVGDDWWSGQVPDGSIDLRWSTSPITDANFAAATQVAPPDTVSSGALEQVNVTGLPTNGQTIFFAERATDDAGNTSLIARARLVTGYPRPKGATPLRASLALAYQQCTSPNRTHGAPLSVGSCAPPVQQSGYLTVGTLDANGKSARSVGSVRFDVTAGDSGTVANEADVLVNVSMTDVRNKSDLADYTGQLQETTNARITDRNNDPGADEPATAQDVALAATVPCTATSDTTVGATCSLSTSLNVLMPGAVVEEERANWELAQIRVFDGGSDGVASTSGNTLFAHQGIFIP